VRTDDTCIADGSAGSKEMFLTGSGVIPERRLREDSGDSLSFRLRKAGLFGTSKMGSDGDRAGDGAPDGRRQHPPPQHCPWIRFVAEESSSWCSWSLKPTLSNCEGARAVFPALVKSIPRMGLFIFWIRLSTSISVAFLPLGVEAVEVLGATTSAVRMFVGSSGMADGETILLVLGILKNPREEGVCGD